MTQHNEMHERFDDAWLTLSDIVNNEGDEKAKVYLKSFIDSEISLAVAKREKEIVDMIEKEIDRITDGDIKMIGLRKALKLIQTSK